MFTLQDHTKLSWSLVFIGSYQNMAAHQQTDQTFPFPPHELMLSKSPVVSAEPNRKVGEKSRQSHLLIDPLLISYVACGEVEREMGESGGQWINMLHPSTCPKDSETKFYRREISSGKYWVTLWNWCVCVFYRHMFLHGFWVHIYFFNIWQFLAKPSNDVAIKVITGEKPEAAIIISLEM